MIAIDLLAGFFAGIAATYAYQIYSLTRKPSIELANEVSMESLDDLGHKHLYSFKLRNCGRNQVVDITLKAWLCKLVEIDGAKVSKGVYEFCINNSNTRTLAPEGKSDRPWGLTSEAELSAESEVNVPQFLSDSSHRIMVTVKASDAISGTTIVQQQTYSNEDIKEGIFGFRDRMAVEVGDEPCA